MKRRIALASLGALLLLACTRETPVSPVMEPEIHTIRAGFAGDDSLTRSRLSFEESAAKVLWSRGDAFKMIMLKAGSGYQSATFTTQDDGVGKATFTTSEAVPAGEAFTSGYPASVYRVGRKGETVCILITPVPSVQQAVPGGIAEGLNRAAAFSTTATADLQFYNMLSFVRFRLDGACVSSLDSVVFEAGATVAGDASVYFEEGEPKIDFSKNWSNVTEPRSTSITLEGPFEAGQDYLMAMVPTQLLGFDMVFKGPDGKQLSKHSSKPLALERSRIVDFGTIQLGDSWEVEKPDVLEYIHQTKGTRKNVIAVLAEGFTADEQDKFERLAKSGIDYMFSVEPFKSYRDYFTVYLHRVVSNESGASVTDGNGTVVTARDTYFGAGWGESSYSDMLADPARIQEYLKTHCPEVLAGELTYKDVPALLIVNDERYGGRCISYSNGWAYCIVPYQYGGKAVRWSFPKYQAVNQEDDSEGYRETTDEERDALGRHVGDWRNTLLHEFGGHCYSRLTDEYWNTSYVSGPAAIAGHSYQVPYAVNASGYYDPVPWQETLLDNLGEWEEVNPEYGRIGKYQGATSSIYFRWRSEPVSCMIDNRPYFNTWSRILIVRRILEKAGETFDLDAFREKDVMYDPVRPVADATPALRWQMRAQAEMVPEMPLLLPPVIVEEDDL